MTSYFSSDFGQHLGKPMKIYCKRSNPAGNQSRPFFDLKWSGPTAQESFRRGFLWFIFNSVFSTAVCFFGSFFQTKKELTSAMKWRWNLVLWKRTLIISKFFEDFVEFFDWVAAAGFAEFVLYLDAFLEFFHDWASGLFISYDVELFV